jgi:hypothetical protein
MMAKFVLLLVLLIGEAAEACAEEGVWTPNDDFAQINVFCTRVYKCGPSTDIVYGGDKKLVFSSPKLVQGVCSASGGAADSCNECLTNPPQEICEWHLQAK